MLRLRQSISKMTKCFIRRYSSSKKTNSQETIRNIGILAHIDAGKNYFTILITCQLNI